MSSLVVILVLLGYFTMLMGVSFFTSRKVNEESFFMGNRRSPWFVVAIGNIGAAISGVTFVSLPGTVGTAHFHLAQFIFGNVVGYLLISFVLIPLYYKLRLVSIYGYLKSRFGYFSNKTGAGIFLISQSFGAALRLLLAIRVLQVLFFDKIGISMTLTSIIILILVWLYTHRGGIKTIIWTDMLQTFCLILTVVISFFIILNKLDLNSEEILQIVQSSPKTKLWEWETNSPFNFWKQFISGILISLAMMGLDQNMMQKSLTCKNLRDAQKNLLSFSLSVGVVQLLFLCLGVALYTYVERMDVALPENLYKNGVLITDRLFPFLANNEFGIVVSICFLVGICASAFSSIDSSLTALTTSFFYDFIKSDSSKKPKQTRNLIHIGFSLFLLIICLVFSNSEGDIFSIIFKIAGYTYGPLLGLFALGILSKWQIQDRWVPWVSLVSPVITYLTGTYLEAHYGFDIGFLAILINALIFVMILSFGSFLKR